MKREAEKVEHTAKPPHRYASLAQTRTTWSRSRRALEDAGVIFIARDGRRAGGAAEGLTSVAPAQQSRVSSLGRNHFRAPRNTIETEGGQSVLRSVPLGLPPTPWFPASIF